MIKFEHDKNKNIHNTVILQCAADGLDSAARENANIILVRKTRQDLIKRRRNL